MSKSKSVIESLTKEPLSVVELLSKANPDKVNQVLDIVQDLVVDAQNSLKGCEDDKNAANNKLIEANQAVVDAEKALNDAKSNEDTARDAHLDAISARQGAEQNEKDAQTLKDLADKNFDEQGHVFLNEQTVILEAINKLTPLATSP